MNSRVASDVICGPLSDTASRIGRAGSSSARSSRSGVTSSIRPSISSARSKITATWVEVSSTDMRVSIHLRDTRSTIANTHRRAAVKVSHVPRPDPIRFPAPASPATASSPSVDVAAARAG